MPQDGLLLQFLEDAGDVMGTDLFRASGAIEHHSEYHTVMSHSLRVAWCAFRLSRALGLSPEHERNAVQAALMHDLTGDGITFRGEHSRRRLDYLMHHGERACANMAARLELNERVICSFLKENKYMNIL